MNSVASILCIFGFTFLTTQFGCGSELGSLRCGQNELGALCWVPGSHKEPAVVERHLAELGRTCACALLPKQPRKRLFLADPIHLYACWRRGDRAPCGQVCFDFCFGLCSAAQRLASRISGSETTRALAPMARGCAALSPKGLNNQRTRTNGSGLKGSQRISKKFGKKGATNKDCPKNLDFFRPSEERVVGTRPGRLAAASRLRVEQRPLCCWRCGRGKCTGRRIG